MSGFTLFSAPGTDPVTLIEAKGHLHVDSDDEDGDIAALLLAARQHIETTTGRVLISQTWDYTIDRDWPWLLDFDSRAHLRVIEIPKPPLQSVTSISYVDTAGVSQTLASNQYLVDAGSSIGRVYQAYGVTWPSVRCQAKAITVRFVAGYGAAPGNIPEALRRAILLLVGHWYENREAVQIGSTPTEMPLAVASLLAPYKVYI